MVDCSYSGSPLVFVRLVDYLLFSKLVELGDYFAPSVLVSQSFGDFLLVSFLKLVRKVLNCSLVSP